MYAQQAVGGGLGIAPAELAQQQERWEKDRIANERAAYRSQVAHMALTLLAGVNGHAWKPDTALKAVHEILQGAKTFDP